MSTTFPKGFAAAGLTAGLKASGKPDLALVVNRGPEYSAAAVYTANRARAHPVNWSEQASADGYLTSVLLNSGGANCFTGPQGFGTVHQSAELVAEHLGTSAADTAICSTGLIGVWSQDDFEARILAGIPGLVEAVTEDEAGGAAAAEAIMTTDTAPKTTAIESAGFRVGGMAKGAGMLAPALATMLVVVTTDARATPAALDAALRRATRVTFDRLDTDGCMSTNDSVILLASGASGVEPSQAELDEAILAACQDLAGQLHVDAEGANHDIAITTLGAASEDEAVEVSRAVSRSNLLKAAIAGEDPNWGRVLAQVGTTTATFDPKAIDIAINGVMVCRAGAPGEDPAGVVFDRKVTIDIDLHAGDSSATILTSDLTHEYVEENSVYST